MDIDEKLKQEQLEYYKRENELREETIKRQEETIDSAKSMFKAFALVFIALILFLVGCMVFGIVKSIISDYLFNQYLKLH